MKYILIGLLLILTFESCAKKENHADMRLFLVEQLKNTHTQQDWFVPTNKALEGLTFEQANVKDSTDNHSISEIVSHILYWNEINLRAFKEEEVDDNITNDNQNAETFKISSGKDWSKTVQKLDSIQTEWELAVEKTSDQQIYLWQHEIADIAAHNAYHTGQIIYIRKKNGWWK
ncbi:DinB family protein [Aquimarina sp. U1-2]|uniref:DinB family protein n=1 Tax=Aquimarina sp. U1-2 TaxID=2823141 RepID=UPI001AECE267|nr:DinB family protein [Aquimarina sp. U1-2]MBP2832392.1 DinB family protein [Aquimarina sp. U1-2]